MKKYTKKPWSHEERTILSQNYYIVDAEALAELLERLGDDESWKEQMSQSALVAFEKPFSAPLVLAKWSKLLGQPLRVYWSLARQDLLAKLCVLIYLLKVMRFVLRFALLTQSC